MRQATRTRDCFLTVIILLSVMVCPAGEVSADCRGNQEDEDDAPWFDLGLSVNYGGGPEVVPGTPVILTVFFSNRSAERAGLLKQRIEYYSEKVGDEEKEKAKDVVGRWQSELDGIPDGEVTLSAKVTPMAGWINFEILEEGEYKPLSWGVELLKAPEGEEVTVGGERIELVFAVPPGSSRGISAGSYTLRAKLAEGIATGIEDEGISNDASITFSEGAEDADLAVVCNYLTARYYLLKGDYEQAENYAELVLNSKPENIKAMYLLGQIQEGAGNAEEAEKTFRRALTIFYRNNPGKQPPRYLVKKTSYYLRERIKKAQEEK